MANRLAVFIIVLQCFCLGLLLTLLIKPGPNASDVYLPVFTQAIMDAAKDNTVDDVAVLFPINKTNSKIQWQSSADGEWLKVVTWKSQKDFEAYYDPLKEQGEVGTVLPKYPIWVTVVPQVKEFCQRLTYPDKSFRLKQYLGLDPNRRYETFIELWVQEKDLIRPCPDPEINDDVCELQMNHRQAIENSKMENYGEFFDNLVASSYSGSGAPWTRLGYTYDWAYNRRNVGASEYILIPNGRYKVIAGYTTEAYCSDRH